NTANDASAMSEVSYMINNNNEVSYHFAVDDTGAVQGIPLERNTWNAGDGNGKGNRASISIEICYSKSGGERFLKAEQNAAYLTASLLKERGWGMDRVKKHQDWSGKYCPHRTLDLGWQRFLDMVQAYLDDGEESIKKESSIVNVEYAVMLEGGRILPPVTNLSDYAGLENHKIIGFMAKADRGHLKYQVHVLGGGWLPYVDGYDWKDAQNGYAGNGKIIDGLRMYYDTPSELIQAGGYRKVKYRVSPIGSTSYYAYQLDDEVKKPSMDGYAGVFGTPIDKIQVIIE
ncbi:MAG: N-acetylmuramoyl-L-alanine amidase, partial [Lachnospiraceae bacterium]|nr:N-acetylmuramoyl-L-alanine amidase [Lachnospiraceae bacterium]